MTLSYAQRSGGRAVLRFVANATVNVTANSTVNSDVSSGNDQVTGASITQVYWSVPATANVTISRGPIGGANNLFVLNGSGCWNFRDGGITMPELANSTIVVTFSAVGGTVVMEVARQYETGNPPNTGGT
jgi:hypothetical protein